MSSSDQSIIKTVRAGSAEQRELTRKPDHALARGLSAYRCIRQDGWEISQHEKQVRRIEREFREAEVERGRRSYWFRVKSDVTWGDAKSHRAERAGSAIRAARGTKGRLPRYSAALQTKAGKRFVFQRIRYFNAKNSQPGRARELVFYAIDGAHGLEDGSLCVASNMGEHREEIGEAFNQLEIINRAAAKNAKIGFHGIMQSVHELSPQQQFEIAKSYAEDVFGKQDLPYVVVLHEPNPDGDQRNWHVHIVYGLRPMVRTGKGEWETGRFLRTDLDNPAQFKRLRGLWADELNHACERASLTNRYTAKTYQAEGMDIVPQQHLGQALTAMVRRGDAVYKNFVNYQAVVRNSLVQLSGKAQELLTQTVAATAEIADDELKATAAALMVARKLPSSNPPVTDTVADMINAFRTIVPLSQKPAAANENDELDADSAKAREPIKPFDLAFPQPLARSIKRARRKVKFKVLNLDTLTTPAPLEATVYPLPTLKAELASVSELSNFQTKRTPLELPILTTSPPLSSSANSAGRRVRLSSELFASPPGLDEYPSARSGPAIENMALPRPVAPLQHVANRPKALQLTPVAISTTAVLLPITRPQGERLDKAYFQGLTLPIPLSPKSVERPKRLTPEWVHLLQTIAHALRPLKKAIARRFRAKRLEMLDRHIFVTPPRLERRQIMTVQIDSITTVSPPAVPAVPLPRPATFSAERPRQRSEFLSIGRHSERDAPLSTTPPALPVAKKLGLSREEEKFLANVHKYRASVIIEHDRSLGVVGLPPELILPKERLQRIAMQQRLIEHREKEDRDLRSLTEILLRHIKSEVELESGPVGLKAILPMEYHPLLNHWVTHARFDEVKRQVRKPKKEETICAVRDWYEANRLNKGDIHNLARIAETALLHWPAKELDRDMLGSIKQDVRKVAKPVVIIPDRNLQQI